MSARLSGETDIEAFQQYQLLNSFFRLYELYFTLSRRGLLDKEIGDSYERVIRMFLRMEAFPGWWAQAKHTEYQGRFADHIDAIVTEMRHSA